MNSEEVRGPPEKEHGPLYWFYQRNQRKVIAGAIVLIALFFLFRDEWQPLAVLVRRFASPVLLAVAFLWLVHRWVRGSVWWKRYTTLLLALGLVTGGGFAYQYLALWVRYNGLVVEHLDELPETAHERIPALHAVHSLAQGTLDDSKNVTRPAFVRIRDKEGKEDFYFTMGIEPSFAADKIFGSVKEMIATRGTTASLDLGTYSRRPVQFAVGEDLWLSSNSGTAVRRGFDLGMFFSYEPAESRFLIDDQGAPIQVISLIRWRGIFFPYPEFGGVIVVHEQKSSSLGGYFRRVVLGEGKWVPPERTNEFSYLAGQNILPERASNYIVESMRFKNGLSLPLFFYHEGDVRVPKLVGDLNPMPYATYFKAANGLPGMLYHYYALEPFLEGKHGLVASVLIPADGTHKVLLYDHEKKDEGLFGVSQVAGTVRASKRTYDWETNVPVEHRPFVRIVGGKNKLFFLTTIVTYKDSQKSSYLGVPELAITDPANSNGESVWVDPKHPEEWSKGLE